MSYIGSKPANKPLTSSDITDSIVSLPKLSSGTDGNLITYDASGNPVAVATGNDGQVLTSTGAGSPPAFEAISASGVSDSFQAIGSGSGTISGALAVPTELHDDGGNYAVATGRYTAPSDGYYLFVASALKSTAAGTNFYFTKNGSAVNATNAWGYSGDSNQNQLNTYGILSLSSGDYVNIYSSTTVYKYQFINFGGCKLY